MCGCALMATEREHWPKEEQREIGTKGSRAGEEGLGTGKGNKGLATL